MKKSNILIKIEEEISQTKQQMADVANQHRTLAIKLQTLEEIIKSEKPENDGGN